MPGEMIKTQNKDALSTVTNAKLATGESFKPYIRYFVAVATPLSEKLGHDCSSLCKASSL